MNAKELAALLNGREYGEEITREEAAAAKAAGLVVAYGTSDDLLEFDGAIYDEAGAPGTVLVDAEGLLPSFETAVDRAGDDEEEMFRYMDRKSVARAIEAVWQDNNNGEAWTIKTDIPHETFTIVEDGEAFSRGIVFALADLLPAAAGSDAEAALLTMPDDPLNKPDHQCCGKCEKPAEQTTPEQYKAIIQELANRLQTADLVILTLVAKAGGSVTEPDADAKTITFRMVSVESTQVAV